MNEPMENRAPAPAGPFPERPGKAFRARAFVGSRVFGLLDAVTLKEIFSISRRGQTYVSRVVYVGLIGLILYEFWTSIVAETPFITPSLYANLGRDLFRRFIPLQTVMVTLASIGAAADRVIREEKSGTLGLLLLTPLTPREIAFSKWKAALAQSGSLILCGLPVIAVCAFLGSVTAWDLLWCFSLTGGMAMLGAAFGLRASALYSSVPRALVMGFLYVLGYTLLPLTLFFLAGAGAIFALPFLHPMFTLFKLAYDGPNDGTVWNFAWIPSTLISFGVSVYLLGGVARLIDRKVRLPRVAAPAADPQVPSPPQPTGIRRKGDAPPERKTREVWDRDPLLWKELITRGGSRFSREFKAIFLIYALIFIALCWLFSWGTNLPTFAFLGACFSFLSLINGAALFAPEKEGRKIEMLLSSPVSSRKIVQSKLLAGIISPESQRVAFLAFATGVAFSWWSGPGMLIALGVLFLFQGFVYLLSATASVHAATLQGAALASAGILSVLLLVTPLLVDLVAPSLRVNESLPLGLSLVSSLNPVWVLSGLKQNEPPGTEAWGRFLQFAILYGTAMAALLGILLARFDRKMGRV